jgi:hypothetical protein
MLYMVEAHATFERGNEIDDKGGPGPVLGYITERFKPEGFYFIPTRRAVVMVVSLDGASQIAELMFILTRFTGEEPTFTPLVPMGEAARLIPEAITSAKKAPAL